MIELANAPDANYIYIYILDATMGAKAPIFSEFGAKARNLFRPAPTKKEKQRLSTTFNTTIGAKAPNFTQLDAEAHLPPKMKKQPNY